MLLDTSTQHTVYIGLLHSLLDTKQSYGQHSADKHLASHHPAPSHPSMCFIGASLSEPHTSVIAFAEVCVCLLAAIYLKF